MGQKISPILFRTNKRSSYNNNQSADPTDLAPSVWFAKGRDYSVLLLQDIAIRQFLEQKVKSAGLVNVIIRRYFRKIEITLFVTRPGMIIGRGGSNINALREELIQKFKLPKDLRLDIQEYKDPYRSARIIANELSEAIKKGVPYRKLAKTLVEKVMYSGVVQGVKIVLSGRLAGADIARSETFKKGRMPTHTWDANIDYWLEHCKTKAGIIGIKVFLCKGDKFTGVNV